MVSCLMYYNKIYINMHTSVSIRVYDVSCHIVYYCLRQGNSKAFGRWRSILVCGLWDVTLFKVSFVIWLSESVCCSHQPWLYRCRFQLLSQPMCAWLHGRLCPESSKGKTRNTITAEFAVESSWCKLETLNTIKRVVQVTNILNEQNSILLITFTGNATGTYFGGLTNCPFCIIFSSEQILCCRHTSSSSCSIPCAISAVMRHCFCYITCWSFVSLKQMVNQQLNVLWNSVWLRVYFDIYF